MACGPGCAEHEHRHVDANDVPDGVAYPTTEPPTPPAQRSPFLLSARLRAWVALGFLLWWAALIVWDATSDLWGVQWEMPVWLQVIGVAVLSYVLGIKLPLLAGNGRGSGTGRTEGER